jgi:hypothetical protein
MFFLCNEVQQNHVGVNKEFQTLFYSELLQYLHYGMLKPGSEISLSKFTDNFGSSFCLPFNIMSIKLGLGGNLHWRKNK